MPTITTDFFSFTPEHPKLRPCNLAFMTKPQARANSNRTVMGKARQIQQTGGECCDESVYMAAQGYNAAKAWGKKMGRMIKTLATVAVLAGLGLVIYGYSVDMAPAPQPISQSVVLNGG